jgi:hypothetical protein
MRPSVATVILSFALTILAAPVSSAEVRHPIVVLLSPSLTAVLGFSRKHLIC